VQTIYRGLGQPSLGKCRNSERKKPGKLNRDSAAVRSTVWMPTAQSMRFAVGGCHRTPPRKPHPSRAGMTGDESEERVKAKLFLHSP
jgi:hypothetical protein